MPYTDYSRHVYVIQLDDDSILNLLYGWKHLDVFALPIITEAMDRSTGALVVIPHDTRIERCSYSDYNRCFEVIASHPSFPEVEHGLPIPRLACKSVLIRAVPFKDEGEEKPLVVQTKGIDGW